MIDDHKARGEWKIQLTMKINFVSFLDSTQFQEMHTESNSIEIMIGNETNDIITELFNSLFKIYQEGLETKMKTSSFTFYNVELLYYHLHKISLNRGGSYINSPEWLKPKKAAINPKNNDDECLRYSIIAALNNAEINNNPERISRLRPFIDNYNWNGIEFPSGPKDWKKFEQSNKTISLNVLYAPYNTEQIRPAYISKYNYKRDKQVILLMITDNKKWHYLAVKSTPGKLRGITSNHNGDFYCLSCFHSYTTKNKLKKHVRTCKDPDYCNTKMPNKDNNILKHRLGDKSLKYPFIIYADLECILQVIYTCQNNPNKSYTENKTQHIPSGYALVICCPFDKSKTEIIYYREKYCIENLGKQLRDQATKIITKKKGKQY